MKYPKYKFYYAFLDYLVFFGSFWVSGFATKYFYGDMSYFTVETRFSSLILYAFCSFIFIFIFQYNNLYKINVFQTRALHIAQIIKSLIVCILVLILILFVFKFTKILGSRLFILLFFVISILVFGFVRIIILRTLNYKLLRNIFANQNIIIIGAGKSGKMLAQKLMFENIVGINVVGFLDDNFDAGEIVFKKLQILGKLDDLSSLYIKYGITEVIISIDNIEYERIMEIVDVCHDKKIVVKISSELFNIIPNKIFTERYSEIPVINVSPKFSSETIYFYKRAFDYLATSIGILILSPVFLIISALIKITSEGPVIYKQKRIGKNGAEFDFYKFRSMKVSKNGDKEREEKMIEFIKQDKINDEKSTKIINSKRVTGIGKFIRKTSLDELPQLFNVLKGDMSLVGPRPCLPYEYDHFDEWQKRRNSVIPGCTGLWQVTGRGNVSFNDSVVLDIYYINNATPWLDLQLILKTIPVMVFGKGAK